jgi:hypothetical protein
MSNYIWDGFIGAEQPHNRQEGLPSAIPMAVDPSHTEDNLMTPLMQTARANLDQLTNVLRQNGMTYRDLPSWSMAVGIGVPYGPEEFVVVTISGPPNDNTVYLTTGVLRDVSHDRMVLLELCNSLTAENAAFPTYLHDSDLGWDVHIQQSLPVQLLMDVPPFFLATLGSLPGAASGARERALAVNAGGRHYQWNEEDVERLFSCSFV